MTRSDPPPYVKQADNLHPDRTILYKQGRHLSNGVYFIIEISRHDNFLYISAFDTNSPESLMIEIKADRIEFILD